jgi:hypothetical protein
VHLGSILQQEPFNLPAGIQQIPRNHPFSDRALAKRWWTGIVPRQQQMKAAGGTQNRVAVPWQTFIADDQAGGYPERHPVPSSSPLADWWSQHLFYATRPARAMEVRAT